MTVEQLIWKLLNMPGQMDVRIALNRRIGDIDKIDKCVDMDTKITSVVIYGKDETG